VCFLKGLTVHFIIASMCLVYACVCVCPDWPACVVHGQQKEAFKVCLPSCVHVWCVEQAYHIISASPEKRPRPYFACTCTRNICTEEIPCFPVYWKFQCVWTSLLCPERCNTYANSVLCACVQMGLHGHFSIIGKQIVYACTCATACMHDSKCLYGT
jgi:hypothetical protein